ncbi:MAG TPA: CPBP family intramembrane glutamic endopeptidase [Flavobacterium sp.]|nr:CPBP family intramembrane glutamic endopeptidase [Flavobacterium sp.]
MFLQKAFTYQNQFWKYLVGSLIVIIASTIGQLPLMLAVMMKLSSETGKMPEMNETVLMATLEKNMTLFLMLFSFLIALLGLIFVLRFLHKQKLKDITTSRVKIDWKRIVFAFSIWGVFQIIVTILNYYASPEDFTWNFQLQPFLILLFVATIMIPIQTSVEEYVFRGYLMQGFGLLAKNRWFPLLLTSLIFGGLHFFNPEVVKMGPVVMIYYIGTGLFLGIITLMDEGLELALGFHAANNLITALLVTSEWTAFQTHSVLKDISNPSAGYEVVLPVLVVFPTLLFIFAKKYGWTDWKEKLTGKIETADSNSIEFINND